MMAQPITIYTTQHCPHCARAKNLLKRRTLNFTEVDVTDDNKKRDEVQKRYGMMTVPVIVIGDQWVGGADELYELEQKGELNKYL